MCMWKTEAFLTCYQKKHSTAITAPFYSSVTTVSRRVRYQAPETEAAEWNPAIFCFYDSHLWNEKMSSVQMESYAKHTVSRFLQHVFWLLNRFPFFLPKQKDQRMKSHWRRSKSRNPATRAKSHHPFDLSKTAFMWRFSLTAHLIDCIIFAACSFECSISSLFINVCGPAATGERRAFDKTHSFRRRFSLQWLQSWQAAL